MASEGQSLRKRVIPPQLLHFKKGHRECPPTSRVVQVMSRNVKDTKNKDERSAARSRITEGAGAPHTHTQVDLTAETSAQTAKSSANSTDA